MDATLSQLLEIIGGLYVECKLREKEAGRLRQSLESINPETPDGPDVR